ncbi:unnamed protein product [Vitrella brassicaformis CCMP3155]|uniref:Uncharacterized protein n=1 Tax=Vitrella brassicaformis (strain CCMP3155) TaxID=1169540 RepID=A0A0G4ER55_VITBC|nr:unnamed protein product [Vitrella brassicaformis CCMP3155]|eukprot:CEM00165.1 unnamed protein product [Vitrella brassicaformis CCMP3155]
MSVELTVPDDASAASFVHRSLASMVNNVRGLQTVTIQVGCLDGFVEQMKALCPTHTIGNFAIELGMAGTVNAHLKTW